MTKGSSRSHRIPRKHDMIFRGVFRPAVEVGPGGESYGCAMKILVAATLSTGWKRLPRSGAVLALMRSLVPDARTSSLHRTWLGNRRIANQCVSSEQSEHETLPSSCGPCYACSIETLWLRCASVVRLQDGISDALTSRYFDAIFISISSSLIFLSISF